MRAVRCALVVAFALLAAPLQAATWTLVTHAVNGHADGSGGPFKAPTGAGTVNTTGADLYLCAMSGFNGSSIPTGSDLSDVSGNTYTALTGQRAVGDASVYVVWFYKKAPTTNAAEQWTLAPGFQTFTGLACLAFSGSAGAGATVTSVSSGTTSTTPAGGSIGSAGNLVVAAVGDYPATISSIDSSFAIVDNSVYTGSNNIGIATAWQNLSGGVAGAVNPTWTLGSAPTASVAFNVSVTPSAGGGGPPGCKNGLVLLGAGCEEEIR